MTMINLLLRSFFAALVFSVFMFVVSVSYAQNSKAVPVPSVVAETVPILGEAPIIIELFSSQACVFCPKADRLFTDLLQQDNVIGLACHVDYFDVKEGSLSQSFCTARQSWYMDKLFAGPNYTPQMVINGAIDVVGYKFNEVVEALQKAAYSEILVLNIIESEAAGTYKVMLPMDKVAAPEDFKLWLALYDKPRELTVASGTHKGKQRTYYNIVSNLGGSDEILEEVFVTPPLTDQHEGFVLILQDMSSGKIYAVGQHKKDKQ